MCARLPKTEHKIRQFPSLKVPRLFPVHIGIWVIPKPSAVSFFLSRLEYGQGGHGEIYGTMLGTRVFGMNPSRRIKWLMVLGPEFIYQTRTLC